MGRQGQWRTWRGGVDRAAAGQPTPIPGPASGTRKGGEARLLGVGRGRGDFQPPRAPGLGSQRHRQQGHPVAAAHGERDLVARLVLTKPVGHVFTDAEYQSVRDLGGEYLARANRSVV